MNMLKLFETVSKP